MIIIVLDTDDLAPLTNDYQEKQSFINFLYNLTIDKNENSLFDLDDDFNMYIRIAEGACSSLPKLIIQNHIFKEFRIKKKYFPKKSYYEL